MADNVYEILKAVYDPQTGLQLAPDNAYEVLKAVLDNDLGALRVAIAGFDPEGTINLSTDVIVLFGDENTDGTYRVLFNAEGNLQIEKRESGVWNYKINV